jgi:hypothetical protein
MLLGRSGPPPQAIGMVEGIAKAAGPIAAAQAALWHGFSDGLMITGILSLVALVIAIAWLATQRRP